MKVLLVGNGGHEHALARTLVCTSNAEHPAQFSVQAGNPGFRTLGDSFAFTATESDEVLALAKAHGVELAVVGPETPLVAGVADTLITVGTPCFDPTFDAARLEASKSSTKDVMVEAGVATARPFTCRNMNEVDTAFQELGAPHVVKDDALTAGKGIVVTHNVEEARAHAKSCLEREDGAVVTEDYLDGPEVSLFCLRNGTSVVPLVPAQDFKRAGDANSGPNTGGMGAYSPLPWLDEGVAEEVVRSVAQPTVNAMAKCNTPFVGLLYCGLAITPRGIWVVEFNVHLGDPEIQVVLKRLDSSLVELLHTAATGILDQVPTPQWSADAVVTVVMVSGGYPGPSDTGHETTSIDKAEVIPGICVIQVDISRKTVSPEDVFVPVGSGPEVKEILVNSGGCALNVVGCAATVQATRALAYEGVEQASLVGEHHRSDIATWSAELDLSVGSDLKNWTERRFGGI